ncbi:thiol:disulfide interchange protein DsbD [Abditibacteriota bacterium]|nr:thiol:disulfide interchange protein DsbD [Abditibacteriota bacterium]
MKRWILPTFFVWTLIGAVAIAAWSGHDDDPVKVVEGKSKIAWQPNFEAALLAAREEKKPALVVFESNTCTFCKKMDKTTWRDQRVQNQTRGWVPVKVNGDQRTDLLAAYGVQGFPTAILLGGDGKPFAGREGYIEPGEFVAFLEDSRAKWKG